MPQASHLPEEKAKRRKSPLNTILLILALIFLAAGLYFLIRPIWTRYKQHEVREELLANMDEGRFAPIYVDPNAWADPDEEVEYFVPDQDGGYIQVTGDREAQGVELNPGFGDGHGPSYDYGVGSGQPAGPHALQPLARLVIPKIAVNIPVVEGLNSVNLRYAACHYQETVPIGSIGSAAIFAHRSPAHGRDLNRLNEVQAGDLFTLETETELLTYRVERNIVTAPAGIFEHFHAPVSVSRVILVTCHPIPSWEDRMLVIAKLESREPCS